MQIKPIITAAGALTCFLLSWATVAASAPLASNATLNLDGRITRPGAIVTIAQVAEDMTEANTGQGDPAEQDMANTGKAPATTSIRNTRPRIDRHKDARACLAEANNNAIIKCANRYR